MENWDTESKKLWKTKKCDKYMELPTIPSGAIDFQLKYTDIQHDSDGLISNASEKGHIDIVKYLIERGGRLEMAYWIAVACNKFDIIKYTIEKGVDVNCGNWFEIISKYNPDRVELLDLLRSALRDSSQP